MAIRSFKNSSVFSGEKTADLWDGVNADLPYKTGLVGWWDAADRSTLTMTNYRVTNWLDKSGVGNHVYEPTDYTPLATYDTKPNYVPNGINGLPSLDFSAQEFGDKGGNRALIRRPALGSLASSPTLTCFTVLENFSQDPALQTPGRLGNWNLIWTMWWNSPYPSEVVTQRVHYSTSQGTDGFPTVFIDNSPRLKTSQALTSGFKGIHTWSYGPAISSFYRVNGVQQTTTNAESTSIPAFPSNGVFQIGDSRVGGALSFQGLIGEILIYDSALTTQQVLDVEGYLNKKWKLS
jgi:hypothetical protein